MITVDEEFSELLISSFFYNGGPAVREIETILRRCSDYGNLCPGCPNLTSCLNVWDGLCGESSEQRIGHHRMVRFYKMLPQRARRNV